MKNLLRSDQTTNHAGPLCLQGVPFEDLYRFLLSNDNIAPTCGELCWVLASFISMWLEAYLWETTLSVPLWKRCNLWIMLLKAFYIFIFSFWWLEAGRNESRGKLKLCLRAMRCESLKRHFVSSEAGGGLFNHKSSWNLYSSRALSLYFDKPRVNLALKKSNLTLTCRLIKNNARVGLSARLLGLYYSYVL